MLRNSNHETFAEKLYQKFKDNPHFSRPKFSRSDFTIHHYAGNVSDKFLKSVLVNRQLCRTHVGFCTADAFVVVSSDSKTGNLRLYQFEWNIAQNLLELYIIKSQQQINILLPYNENLSSWTPKAWCQLKKVLCAALWYIKFFFLRWIWYIKLHCWIIKHGECQITVWFYAEIRVMFFSFGGFLLFFLVARFTSFYFLL